VSAGVYFLLRENVSEEIEAGLEVQTVQVPSEFQPIQAYTESCLLQAGKQGLILLGEQGGYLYPETVGEYSVLEPTDSDGVNLEPLKVPYWSYNRELNDGGKIVLSSLQPPLSSGANSWSAAMEEADGGMSIENQLAGYIEEKMESCLQSYVPFVSEGFSVKKSEKPEVVVRVGEESINIWLKNEMVAERGGSIQEWEQFYVSVPLALKKYYDIAATISYYEREYQFLERQSLELLQAYSGVDREKMPPTADFRFDFVPKAYWNADQVKERFAGILSSGVPLLQVAESDNFFRRSFPADKQGGIAHKSYNYMALSFDDVGYADDSGEAGADGGKEREKELVSGEELLGKEINFDYFSWPMYFRANEGGSTIKPNIMGVDYDVLKLSVQQYYTSYDYSYPVLVTIRDPDAFNGEGYNFVFALEANVRNNQPAKADQVLPLVIMSDANLACEEEQWDTEPLKSIVLDGSTGEPLSGVRFGFQIPGAGECYIGQSDENGVMISSYPAAYGGVLNLAKEDYLNGYYPIDTYQYKESALEILGENENYAESKSLVGAAAAKSMPENSFVIYPHKKIKVKVKKAGVEKCVGEQCYGSGLFSFSGVEVYNKKPQQLEEKHRWILGGGKSSLRDEEQAIITLERVGDGSEKLVSDFYANIMVTGKEEQEVNLVPGTYAMSGKLILQDKVKIPAEERCIEMLLGLVDECYKIDEVLMDNYLAGALEWDTPETYLKITPEQLYSSDELELYLPSQEISNVPEEEHIRVIEDIELGFSLGESSKKKEVREILLPLFK
jgi:hypothetical protein